MSHLRSVELLKNQLSLLADLVTVDSSSHNQVGVQRVQDLIAKELEKLGFATRFIPPAKGDFAQLLLAEINPTANLQISLIGHADTVLDNNGARVFEVIKAQNLLFGPGVGDDKGGLVVGLSALAQLSDWPTNVGLKFISSPNEEVGSLGFWDVLQHLGQQSNFVLGLEPALADGSFVTARYGNRWYQIQVEGRPAHAGRANGEEINAAHELSLIITELMALRAQNPDTKVNVGSLSGGLNKFNVVCGQAEAKLDTRFATRDGRDKLHAEISKILSHGRTVAKDGTRARVSYQIVDDCPPLDPGIRRHRAIDFLENTLSELEQRPVRGQVGTGAADSCHMSNVNNVTLDGLGPVAGQMHTAGEFIELNSLATRAYGLTKLLEFLSKQQTP